MKNLKSLLFFAGMAVMLALLNNSCAKAKLNKETVTTEDNTKAESLFNDVFNEVDKNATSYTDGKTAGNTSYATATGDSCATITVDTSSTGFPKTMTVDFGTEYCTGPDGKERKGKIIAVLTGKYRDAGTTVTITTEDFYVDYYKVDGTKIIENITTTGNNPKYKLTVNGEITTPESETITWNSVREREWIEGSDTWLWAYNDSTQKWVWLGLDGIYDDVWEITGSGDGTNRSGRDFTVDITTPLRVQWCEPYIEITEGKIELKPEDLKTRVVDYGDKSCDNEGTITVGNKETTFKFRK